MARFPPVYGQVKSPQGFDQPISKISKEPLLSFPMYPERYILICSHRPGNILEFVDNDK